MIIFGVTFLAFLTATVTSMFVSNEQRAEARVTQRLARNAKPSFGLRSGVSKSGSMRSRPNSIEPATRRGR